MKYVGAHVSIEGGVENAPIAAAEIGARSFALFTGSSARWQTPDIKEEKAEAFKSNCKKLGYTSSLILPHSNFLINLGSPDSKKRAMSLKSFIDELRRCETLGLTMLNFHPGSHVNLISEQECLDLISESVNRALDKTNNVAAIFENTAGQGSNLGYNFEQLAYLIDKVEDKSRAGVCIDTCHAFSAGYDLASEEGYHKVWEDFDSIVGFKYLHGLHLNDDKRELGSRIDRHEKIGEGTLGKEFFYRLMNDPRFDNLPIILETPDDTIWKEEINWLYSLVE